MDEFYNIAAARSQGPGVYALLAGATVPQIEEVSPTTLSGQTPTTLVITGRNFLSPTQVVLLGPSVVVPLRVESLSPTGLTAVVEPPLPSGTYRLQVTNGTEPDPFQTATTTGLLTVSGPGDGQPPVQIQGQNQTQELSACFAENFEAGLGQWQVSGEWGLLQTPDGNSVLTDRSTLSATGNRPLTSLMTSPLFDLTGCNNPVLTLRQDFALRASDGVQLQISPDGGQTWRLLTGLTGPGRAARDNLTLDTVTWNPVTVDLSLYQASSAVRLRFAVSTTADRRGWVWVIDDIVIAANN